jgi:osmoprotectant transport system permease protein
MMKKACVLAVIAGWTFAEAQENHPSLSVGSKAFTESIILGELVAQIATSAGVRAVHRRQLGGTKILWAALLSREIDVYPEYSGTIAQEMLPGLRSSSEEAIRQALAERGVEMSGSLGFNNTYALGMREDAAERLGIRRISDLARHPELRLGFSNEFMDRSDGWPLLRERYALPQKEVRGVDHDLAYRALESGAIQVTDLYSTDAEISYYHLRVLEDDLRVFPEYKAVLLYRGDLRRRAPEAISALSQLVGRIDAREMSAMNARAKLDRVPESRVAAEFLAGKLGIRAAVREETVVDRMLRHLREHLFLVALSLLAAIAVALPLGIISARFPRVGQLVLGTVGIIQTIPSLALLVFMIPLLGIGAKPSIVALFLYSLLPIVRNTASGLRSIPLEMRESAEALGLPGGARLRLIELPMASPAILAGIKTSAVINVGTATLGALIGAGGFGQPILTGIRLNDVRLILEGAVPAAVLALLVQGLFEVVERVLVPRGLRLPASSAR